MTEPGLPEHCEIVIVGGGHAAMCAAITAAEAGAEVVVLEGAPHWIRGGNSRHTRNLRAMHAGPVAMLEGRYCAEEFFDDLMRVTDGHTDVELARLMITESNSLLEWLAEQGVAFQQALRGTLNLERTNAFFLGGGKALVNKEYEIARRLGVQIFYQSWVEHVELAEGEFSSVRVRYQGQLHTLAAQAAVLACGGFQANEAWMREAWGPAADNFLIRGTPYNTGVVLRDLLNQGVDSVADATQCHAVAIDARAPKYDGGIVSRLDCVPYSVVVNQQGERFYDEGEDFWPKRYAIWGRLIAEQPGQIAYAIFDAQVMNHFMPSVYPVIQANSLSELAGLLEINPQALAATLAQFNAAVAPDFIEGYDPLVLDGSSTRHIHPAKTNWARPVQGPPFYAYPLRPGITFTYLGLRVNHLAQVLIEQQASRNLFAAGEIMAGNILGQGYCAGTGMTIGGVFGRIAGREAACLIR